MKGIAAALVSLSAGLVVAAVLATAAAAADRGGHGYRLADPTLRAEALRRGADFRVQARLGYPDVLPPVVSYSGSANAEMASLSVQIERLGRLIQARKADPSR